MRMIAGLLLLFGAGSAAAQFRGEITVTRFLLDARVTDSRGNPVPDLAPEDFLVTIGGEVAEVESAEWIEDVPSAPVEVPVGSAPAGAPPAPGRLFVLFAQTDHARESFRLRGQINFILEAEKMIAELEPEDRLAVFQFDSHLKFRHDFTRDKDAVVEALKGTLSTNLAPLPAAGEPSLLPFVDADAMKSTWTVEDALAYVGRALGHLPGPKSMLLLGWGMGIRSGSGAVYPRWQDYGDAVRALNESRTRVFSLDVAWADAHDLASGLMQLARDTGGFYASTFRFPDLVVDRLERTLSGHYELVVTRPRTLAPGNHPLEVTVLRAGATVYVQSMVSEK
jgi:VWFA-related protein